MQVHQHVGHRYQVVSSARSLLDDRVHAAEYGVAREQTFLLLNMGSIRLKEARRKSKIDKLYREREIVLSNLRKNDVFRFNVIVGAPY